jgi:hypothetical protein
MGLVLMKGSMRGKVFSIFLQSWGLQGTFFQKGESIFGGKE